VNPNSYTYEVLWDECPDQESPRDWDNLGTMVCWHTRCSLGDETVRSARGKSEQFGNQQDLYDFTCSKDVISLPIYLYEHSGQTVRTYPFGDRWDSGQVGWIVCTKEKVRKWFGWTAITEKRLAQVKAELREEVSTYDEYLRGDVYFWKVMKDGEVVEAVYGYLGQSGKAEAEREAKACMEALLKITWIQPMLVGMEASNE